MTLQKPLYLLCSLLLATHSYGVTVFSDDFNEADGTLLNGKSPDIGTAYNVLEGAAGLTVTGGQYNTTGAKRVVFANFSAAPSALLPQFYATVDVTLISHNGGVSGFSFYDGPGDGDERFFFGDRSGVTTTWGLERSGGGPSGDAAGYSGPHVVTFAYNFNTGVTELYDGPTATGTPLVGFTTTTGLALNRFRGLNDGGGDYAVSNFVATAVPEAGASALLLTAAGTVLLRRRRQA